MKQNKLMGWNNLSKYLYSGIILIGVTCSLYLYFFVKQNIYAVYSPDQIRPRDSGGFSDVNATKIENIIRQIEKKNIRNSIETNRDIFSKENSQHPESVIFPPREEKISSGEPPGDENTNNN